MLIMTAVVSPLSAHVALKAAHAGLGVLYVYTHTHITPRGHTHSFTNTSENVGQRVFVYVTSV